MECKSKQMCHVAPFDTRARRKTRNIVGFMNKKYQRKLVKRTNLYEKTVFDLTDKCKDANLKMLHVHVTKKKNSKNTYGRSSYDGKEVKIFYKSGLWGRRPWL